MEENSFKLDKSKLLKNLKKQKQYKSTIISFNSEHDSNCNTINISSPKATNRLNNNSYNNNFYNILTKETDSKNNISEEYNINSINTQNANYSTIFLKSYSQSNFKINNNNNKNNFSNNSNNNNINNTNNIPLRNSPLRLNSGKISTVKEEQEQNSYIIDNNKNNSKDNEIKEDFKIQIFYEGKYIELILNKNDKFKNLYLLAQKKLFPYHQLINYDILYKLKAIDIDNSFNMKLIDVIGDLPNGAIVTFLLRRKNKITEAKNIHETTVTIKNFPSLTDLAIDLNYFFKKETRESDFIVDYKNTLCKVIFNYPEKAFSLVSFLSKLKLQKPIYKRLKVNLDYKINVETNINKNKQKPQKIILPSLNKKIIKNLQNKNKEFYIKDPCKSPSYRRKNIKLFLPNYFSFSKRNKNNGEDILFLYNEKQKEKELNTINNNKDLNIISYNDIKSSDKNIYEIKNNTKNTKKLSLFDNIKKSEITPKKIKRNSVFYKLPINLNIDNIDKNNNINVVKENNMTNNLNSNKNIMIRSWSNLDKLKSRFLNNKENETNKNNDNKNINNKPTEIDNNINNINNNEKITINENNNKDLNLMELLKETKISDDSNESFNEERSTYDKINDKNNNKYLYKNKNKEFMFFKGLTKRAKRKNNKYFG